MLPLVRNLAVACLAAAAMVCHAATDAMPVPAASVASTNAANAPRSNGRLEEDELRGLLTTALTQRRGEKDTEWEFNLTRPWTPISVPDEPLSLEILEPALNRITSNCILKFELRAAKRSIGTWQAAVQARCWRPVLVAHTMLRRGQALREEDFARERRDLLALRDPLAEFPPTTAEYELAETVPVGAALTARAVRLKPVLARGQLADAIIREGAMIISLKVEILEEGVPGQMIRVRNPQSRRELRGKVLDEQTVSIPL
jgi:flagella basal body P-ring formation protein FlgA